TAGSSFLAALESLEFLEGARPGRSQKARKSAIRKNFSTSLASSTVVRFVVRVANPLNPFSTPPARLSIASVNRHFLAKGGHLFGKGSLRLRAQPVDPQPEGIARRSEQSFPFVRLQLVRER